MKKRCFIKSLSFATFLLTLLWNAALQAQRLDHQLGIITVQLKTSADIEQVITENRIFFQRETEIRNDRLVSEPFRIWNIAFNHNKINEFDFLKHLRQQPLIENAQFDFFLEERNAPNDLFYSAQYFLKNTGQNGGTPGVDLDAELAWNTTTGGVTLNGDTIVLCIIDENFDYLHEDLYGNLWINHDEIPDDGIDNDGIGYPDDYLGWNVVDSSDNIDNNGSPGDHGTQVAGIAGAKGNNNTGVSGINWNVKLMLVTRGYLESHAIAAYTYPYLMRKKYNETNGAKGAFVVATNTSWGVNYGTPADAPAWCAIYDSLGSVGILSAAATANLNINVDEEGDLPTTCPSNFLVTTTKVDNTDNLPWNTAYGPISIDLAAFGRNVFTTKANDQYGNLSGTSAAAPQLAGAIALLYSTPCPSFIALAKNQPMSASLLVKEYIMEGVDPNPNLQNLTVTGGRLNIANSLQLLMNECNYSGCYPPYSIVINGITQHAATVNWLTGLETNSVGLRYRAVGAPDWITLSNITSPFNFNFLLPCTSYEFQLVSTCGPLWSDYSLSYVFQTAGCCSAPLSVAANDIGAEQLVLEWDEVPTANYYCIRYRKTDAPFWNVFYVQEPMIPVTGLSECTTYEFQVQSICGIQTSNYSQSYFATTSGCGECTELPYCAASASPVTFAWIESVKLYNIDHTSGNSQSGYSDFTEISTALYAGQGYEIQLKSNSYVPPFPGIFKAWIDFNQDGQFNDFDELILLSSNPVVSTTKTIYIPAEANIGSTRMRIAFLQQNSGPCGQSAFIGEFEDYCVDILELTDCLPPIGVQYLTDDSSVDMSWYGNVLNDSYLVKYKKVTDSVWEYAESQNPALTIPGLSECTSYECEIYAICDGEPSLPTPLYYFKTKGCGACLDFNYCPANNANASFEWIERVQISTLDNTSGNNGGYALFSDHLANLEKGSHYPLIITPGFSSPAFEGYYNVWIDLNQDGVLDQDEIVFQSNAPSSNPVQGIIAIPKAALCGSTRMRVIMKYLSAPSSACASGFFGEIEEYCINIVDNDSEECTMPYEIGIDTINQFTSISWEEVADAISYNVRYRKSVEPENWIYIYSADNPYALNHLEACTKYKFQIRTICPQGVSQFTDLMEFKTSCEVSVNSQSSEETETSFQLYPNPAGERFYLDFTLQKAAVINLELFDVSGKLVSNYKFSTSAGDHRKEIAFNKNSPEGMYFLKISLNGQPASVLKVIKVHGL